MKDLFRQFESLEQRNLLTATLVADINATGVLRTAPEHIVSTDQATYFVANDAGSGTELWQIEGNQARIVADLTPGEASTQFADVEMTTVGDQLFFVVEDVSSSSGFGLWVSEGTAETTRMVSDQPVVDMVALGDQLLFVTQEAGDADSSLWTLDTTVGDTSEPVFVHADFGRYAKHGTTTADLHYFISVQNDVKELWVTDGTTQGTRVFGNQSNPDDVTVIGSNVFLTTSPFRVARDNETLWVIDAASGDAKELENLSANATLLELNDQLYILAENQVRTLAGTDQPSELIFETSEFPIVHAFGAEQRIHFFTAETFLTTATLNWRQVKDVWTTDGTTEGTTRLARSRTGTRILNVEFTPAAAYVYTSGTRNIPDDDTIVRIEAATGETTTVESADREVVALATDGERLIRVRSVDAPSVLSGTFDISRFDVSIYDPAAAELTQIQLATSGTETSAPTILGTVDRKLFFTASDGLSTSKLYVISDGGDPLILGNFKVCNDCQEAVRFGNQLLFSATGDDGPGIWGSDGTAEGTRLLRAFAELPLQLTLAGDSVAFLAIADEALQLFRTDGTPLGTQVVETSLPGLQVDSGVLSSRFDVWFDRGSLHVTQSREGIWREEGDSQSTFIPNSNRLSIDSQALYAGDTLYAPASRGEFVQHWNAADAVWEAVSDARLFKDGLVEFNDAIYFLAGSTVWKHTPGDAQAERVREFDARGVNGLTAVGDQLFFYVQRNTRDQELWASDGNADGTQLLLSSADSKRSVGQLEDKLVFLAGDGLWRTDGTVAGTEQFATGDQISPVYTETDQNRFFYSDVNDTLWASDLTSDGTQAIGHLANVWAVTATDDQFYFVATDHRGTELWSYVDELASDLVGDLDGAGLVGFADFLQLSANYNQEGDPEDGDLDGSGIVDFADFLLLSANFGKRR